MSAYSIALAQVLRTLARIPDRWGSGNGRPTHNISSSLRAICTKTKAHNYCSLLIHISVLFTILVLIFGRVDVFVWLLGFIALGLESTLPIPQFITLVTFVFKHCALTVLHLVITSRSLYMGSGCQHL